MIGCPKVSTWRFSLAWQSTRLWKHTPNDLSICPSTCSYELNKHLLLSNLRTVFESITDPPLQLSGQKVTNRPRHSPHPSVNFFFSEYITQACQIRQLPVKYSHTYPSLSLPSASTPHLPSFIQPYILHSAPRSDRQPYRRTFLNSLPWRVQ